VLTQEAVYGTLLRPQREMYHEWVGEALEALSPERLEEYYEVLAYHYVRSGNKDKAVEYLDLANQKATRASAMEEAKGYTGGPESPDTGGKGVGSSWPCLGLVPEGGAPQRCGDPGPDSLDAAHCRLCVY
jgi:hypothetical protein